MKRKYDYEKKPCQSTASVQPKATYLHTRGFAPLQTDLDEDATLRPSGYTENLLEKIINQHGAESADTPVQAKPMNRLRKPLQSKRLAIQAKLSIGEPNDKYEKEADATASKVVQQINSTSQNKSVQKQESWEEEDELQMKPISSIQREESMEEEDEELQMKSLVQRRENLGGGEASTDLESSIQNARGGGQSLDASLKAKMGQAMGADFSNVKVHTDSQSDQLNKSIQAKAFTTGQDVFFRQGAYDPNSQGGQELIAHELTHVVQQNGGAVQRKSLDNNPAGSHAELQNQSNHPSTMIYLQRMPLYSEVRDDLGEPKKDGKRPFTGKVVTEGTKYKAVLKALQDYEKHIWTNYTASDKPALRQQMVTVDKLLQDIYDAMSVYRGNKKKAKYMIRRKQEVLEQQDIVAQAFLKELDRDVPRNHNLLPSLNSIINIAKENSSPVELNEDQKLGSKAGGSKTVGQYAFDGKEGYFKEDVKTLDPLAKDAQAFEDWSTKMKAEVRNEGVQKGWEETDIITEQTNRMNAKSNEYNVGIDAGGINQNDARLASRDIAMSRLDQLLGTKMIARAQFAIVVMGDGKRVEGNIMDNAKKYNTYSPKEHVENLNLSNEEKGDAIGLKDPNFFRLTSRLHLIDLLANQVDRNVGNYFIERDPNGKIVGVTGIDNDMSFGNKELHTGKQQRQALPSISKFVDRDMAQAILSINPEMLRIILRGILSPEDVNAALVRLTHLQGALEGATLLAPEEWIQHLDEIKAERKTYGDALFRYY